MRSTLKKSLLVAGVIGAIALAGAIRAGFTDSIGELGVVPQTSTGVMNLVVKIDDRTFSMSNGVGVRASAPGAAVADTIRVIGEPALGDVNRDGRRDAAMLIQNEPGGSGSFYFAVLAVGEADSYHATNALLMGDRIAPLTVDCLDGAFVYNYLDRQPGEPMTARPTVQKSLWIKFDRASNSISGGA